MFHNFFKKRKESGDMQNIQNIYYHDLSFTLNFSIFGKKILENN